MPRIKADPGLVHEDRIEIRGGPDAVRKVANGVVCLKLV
jgi:hypothetical protein